MMENDDVVVESSKLVSVNKLELCGDTAYVCYTSHGCFSYKGTKNDDVTVLTCVMRRVNGRWMVMMDSVPLEDYHLNKHINFNMFKLYI